jgi:hypothetical protein
MHSNELKEQEAQSKGDAARHGLEQPSARQPSPRNASEHDADEAGWRDFSECAKPSPSRPEPVRLHMEPENNLKVENLLNASDADSRASTETRLRLQAVGSLANPRMPSKHLSHLFELDVVRGLIVGGSLSVTCLHLQVFKKTTYHR